LKKMLRGYRNEEKKEMICFNNQKRAHGAPLIIKIFRLDERPRNRFQ